MEIIIGNKGYVNLNLNEILDNFEDINRCNLGLPNNNNGTKHGKLWLCNHLYINLIRNKDLLIEFKEKYRQTHLISEIEAFYENFNEKDFLKINYAYVGKPGKILFNLILKMLRCPFYFSKTPRTGYTVIFLAILRRKNIFVSNFTISRSEIRDSFYVKKNHAENSTYHSSQDEINILNWLHENKVIDASLCLLQDSIEPEFDCIEHFPSKIIINKVLKFYGSCTLFNLNNRNFADEFIDCNIEINGEKLKIKN